MRAHTVILLGVIFSYGLLCAQQQSPMTLVQNMGCGSRVGEIPHTPLIEAPDGLLYGTTSTGGEKCGGSIFTVDRKIGNLTVVYSLDPAGAKDGDRIEALVLATDGNFYGVTCGASVQGVFQFAPSGARSGTLKYLFSQPDFGCPTGLIEGSDGNLYGTTYYGGSNGWGLVFSLPKINLNNAQPCFLSTLGPDAKSATNPGQTLFAGVIEASDGLLYGETYSGGNFADPSSPSSNSYGTIYYLSKEPQSGCPPGTLRHNRRRMFCGTSPQRAGLRGGSRL